MNQQVTRAIVLRRTNYGEADRILTLLTPDHGKLRVMARGVRKVKSKLAGGIELFSVSDVTYISGRGEMKTLVSTRLAKHYGEIAKNLERVQLGYELIKQIDKTTEDEPESEYFELLKTAFAALNDAGTATDLIAIWFRAQLLRLGGHTPNLQTDTAGNRLAPGDKYSFDFDAMTFTRHPGGGFSERHIKVLRLLFGGYSPEQLAKVEGLNMILPDLAPLVNTMAATYLRT